MYSNNLPGFIAHWVLLFDNFKDIPYLESVCSKHLSSLTYSRVVRNLRKNGFRDFKENINTFKQYFLNILKLKPPVNKFWFLLYIFYENLRITVKVIINYKI